MTKRIALLTTLILSLTLLPGCPGVSPFVETWILTWGPNNLQRGLEVLPDGTATSFVVDAQIGGTLKWFEDGNQFILTQSLNAKSIYSAGLSDDGNSMAGALVTWFGADPGTGDAFTAVKQ